MLALLVPPKRFDVGAGLLALPNKPVLPVEFPNAEVAGVVVLFPNNPGVEVVAVLPKRPVVGFAAPNRDGVELFCCWLLFAPNPVPNRLLDGGALLVPPLLLLRLVFPKRLPVLFDPKPVLVLAAG